MPAARAWRRRRLGALLLALAVGAAAVLGGCGALPALDGRVASTTLAHTQATELGAAVAPLLAAHPGLSGVYPLADGPDAFAARVLMADNAQRSLDVQYYIWHKDITGLLLFDALRKAAARGVRVRLLLDDNSTAGLDDVLALLDAEPNVEVRLFNPFVWRGARLLGYASDFQRLNRRMHNKSFTADNQATIVGGRNVGDEYFGAAGDVLFSDLDVIAIGPVVDAVSHDFDRYWNSASAYPLRLLVAAPSPQTKAAVLAEATRIEAAPDALAYRQALARLPIVDQLKQRSLPLAWGAARLVSDDPAKALGRAADGSLVRDKLAQLFGAPQTRLDLVSPYFVPGREGSDALAAMARRGVKVRILTNSLEATDVAAVHAGYLPWRPALLQAGVALFESRRAWRQDEARQRSSRFGSSASSLHAKTFAIDERQIFVGSFNFDPRSAKLNTEMGLVIDNPALARLLSTTLDQRLPLRAYEVHLDANGALYWTARDGEGAPVTRYDTEPGTTFWQRSGVRILALLPIDWLL